MHLCLNSAATEKLSKSQPNCSFYQQFFGVLVFQKLQRKESEVESTKGTGLMSNQILRDSSPESPGPLAWVSALDWPIPQLQYESQCFTVSLPAPKAPASTRPGALELGKCLALTSRTAGCTPRAPFQGIQLSRGLRDQ